jgi:hypothetical protein
VAHGRRTDADTDADPNSYADPDSIPFSNPNAHPDAVSVTIADTVIYTDSVANPVTDTVDVADAVAIACVGDSDCVLSSSTGRLQLRV